MFKNKTVRQPMKVKSSGKLFPKISGFLCVCVNIDSVDADFRCGKLGEDFYLKTHRLRNITIVQFG